MYLIKYKIKELKKLIVRFVQISAKNLVSFYMLTYESNGYIM